MPRFLMALLFVGCLCAAPVRVGSAKLSTAGTTLDGFVHAQGVITYTATNGNLLLVACLVNAPTTINLRMLDAGNTYVKDQYITDDTHGQTLYLYHAANVVGGPRTISCQPISPGGGRLSITGGYTLFVAEYSGFGTSIIGDGSNPLTKIGSGVAPSLGLLQTTNASALLVSVFTSDSSSATCGTTPGSGWAVVQSNDDASSFPCGALMEQIVSTTGNWTASATVASANWAIGIMPYVPNITAPPISSTVQTVVAASGGYWATGLNTSAGTVSTAITFNGFQYVCYATTALAMRIAKINLSSGVVTIVNPGLPNWSGNDQHNSCSLGISSDGSIHITYDMHATTPLIYYKSTAPEDPSAFTGPLSMLGGAPETKITFGYFFLSGAELYYTWQYAASGGFATNFQYAAHYNTNLLAWETLVGLTGGQVTNIGTTPGVSLSTVWLSGAPQTDPSGVIWFNWQGPLTVNPVVGCGAPCAEYLVGYTGSAWKKFDGTAATMPITGSNLLPVYTVNAASQPAFTIFSTFSIDSAGTFFLPYENTDGNGILQEFVVESSTGVFVPHTLTQNTILFGAPNPLLFVGAYPGVSTGPSAISFGNCTYIFYADIFSQRGGEAQIASCDNFATSRKSILMVAANPNLSLHPDEKQAQSGTMSFLFEDTNDPNYGFSYLNNDSSNLGRVSVFTWSPGGSVGNGKTTSAGASVR